MARRFEKLTKFIQTEDDWYPNFPEDKVRVSLHRDKGTGSYRVAVWGADDYGLEKVFYSKSEAKACYSSLGKIGTVSKILLRDLGFVRAWGGV